MSSCPIYFCVKAVFVTCKILQWLWRCILRQIWSWFCWQWCLLISFHGWKMVIGWTTLRSRLNCRQQPRISFLYACTFSFYETSWRIIWINVSELSQESIWTSVIEHPNIDWCSPYVEENWISSPRRTSRWTMIWTSRNGPISSCLEIQSWTTDSWGARSNIYSLCKTLVRFQTPSFTA